MSGPEDPPRWTQGGDVPAGFEALRKADDALVPDALQLNRMLQGVGTRVGQPQLGQPQLGQPQLGQPQLGQPQLGQPTQPNAPSAGMSLGAKLLAALCAVGLIAGIDWWLDSDSRDHVRPQRPSSAARALALPPSVQALPVPAVHDPELPSAQDMGGPEEPAQQPKPPAGVTEHSVRRANGERVRELVMATAPTLDPAAELALLERAQKALRSDPHVALALAEQHKLRFADGVLAQEREMLAIEALVALDKKPAAERRARAFRASFPLSTHLPRLSDLLPSDP